MFSTLRKTLYAVQPVADEFSPPLPPITLSAEFLGSPFMFRDYLTPEEADKLGDELKWMARSIRELDAEKNEARRKAQA